MKYQDYTFSFKGGSITIPAFTESYAKILAQEEAIKRGWGSVILDESCEEEKVNEMDRRQYLTLLDELKTLPVPGTILYTPADKDKTDGHLLLRWEIDEEGLRAITQCNPHCEIIWFPEQVRMCTWDKN